jgi:hypothetical protein
LDVLTGLSYTPLLVLFFFFPFFLIFEYEWLRHWQTLIAGILALIGAGGTVVVGLIGFAHERFARTQSRYRSLLANYAQLPLAVSDLMEYISNCAIALNPTDDRREVAYSPPSMRASITIGELPNFPRNAWSCIIEAMQYGEHEFLISGIAIAHRFQIQRARIRECPTGATLDWPTRRTFTYDCIILYVQLENMLLHVREAKTINVDVKYIGSRVRAAGRVFRLHDEVIDYCQHRAEFEYAENAWMPQLPPFFSKISSRV